MKLWRKNTDDIIHTIQNKDDINVKHQTKKSNKKMPKFIVKML